MTGIDMMSTAGGILALGLVSALVWEAIKHLAPIRGYVLRNTVREWLRSGPAVHELYILLDASFSVFNQTIPRLLAAIQNAVSTAIDMPSRSPHLYDALMEGEPTDAALWRKYAVHRTAKRPPKSTAKIPVNPDAATANQSTLQQRRLRLVRFAKKHSHGPDEEPALMARDRIERFLHRRLDSLQARCESRWGRVNQIGTASVAAILVLVIVRTTPPGVASITAGAALVLWVAAVLLAVLVNETLRGLTERS